MKNKKQKTLTMTIHFMVIRWAKIIEFYKNMMHLELSLAAGRNKHCIHFGEKI